MKIKANYRKGNKVRIISDNSSYNKYRGKVLKIVGVFTSSLQHPGFDDGVGQALYDLKVVDSGEYVPFSLYEYEFEEV